MVFSNLMGTMDRSRLNLPQHRIPTYEATLSRTSSTSTLTNEKQQLRHTDSVSEKHTIGIGAITGEEKVRPTAVIETIFQWALKIIGVASAIVFGVWAPISYRLQQDGNRSNDETQEVLISRMTDLIERVDDLERSLREIGKLKAMEVCSNDEHKVRLQINAHIVLCLNGLIHCSLQPSVNLLRKNRTWRRSSVMLSKVTYGRRMYRRRGGGCIR